MADIVTVAVKSYILIGFVISALAASGHINLKNNGRHYSESLEAQVNLLLRNNPQLRGMPDRDRTKLIRCTQFLFLVSFMVLWLPALLIPHLRK